MLVIERNIIAILKVKVVVNIYTLTTAADPRSPRKINA